MTSSFPLRLLILFLAYQSASAQPQRSEPLLLENAHIVDPVDRTLRTGHIRIEQGRIKAVLAESPSDFQGSRMDLEGKWVIPGLVDMHTHSFGNASPAGLNRSQMLMAPGTAKRMLFSGVTAFVDLFSLEGMIIGLRDRQRDGRLPGADIFCAGPCLTATNGHCSQYGIPTRIINDPEEAERQIGELAAKAPDVVKIVYDNVLGRLPTIDLETLQAAVKVSHRHGLKTVIHVGTWKDAREAAEAGADALTHMPFGPVPEGLPELLRERNVAVIPTLTVHSDLSHIVDSPDLLGRDLLKAVASEGLLEDYRGDLGQDAANRWVGVWLRMQRNHRQVALDSVGALAEAGVTLMVGTDAGNIGVFQGYSVHRELELLVQAGLSPWQALAAATIRPGRFLGQRWGVRPGDAANLVVLSASPIENISNTQRIEAVIHHGRRVDRDGLLAKQ